jgi:hypothetical protein
MLYQQMVDEERALIMHGFLVDPKLVLGNVRIPVVLAKVCELFVDVPADIRPIDYPNLVVTSRFVPLQIRRPKQLWHGESSAKYSVRTALTASS